MRLLYFEGDELCQTPDVKNTEPYAILSHTWGPPDQEVSYSDIVHRTGSQKTGYRKIEFCGRQAAADGLRYFWVDTCCFNKDDRREEEVAINSMFRWYQESARCYVFLSQISAGPPDQVPPQWEPEFRSNRWFTRGWTLQELVAPDHVDFFTDTGHHLGDKRSLEHLVSDITGIPALVLRGKPLSACSVKERFSWAERRQTTYEEDKVYCLLGIFAISLSKRYGEPVGETKQRLLNKIEKASKGGPHGDYTIPCHLSRFPESQHFVAREMELIDLHRALRGNGRRKTAFLYAMGGMGKTQIAVAYAKRHQDNYSAIFWVNAKDEESIQGSFRCVADQILRAHPSAENLRAMAAIVEAGNIHSIVASVKAWLDSISNTRWLLIFDNYDNPSIANSPNDDAIDIRSFLPECDHGAVLITTRVWSLQIGQPVTVRKMERPEDSLEILAKYSRKERLAEEPGAMELAKKLDGLPLALATAGAFLGQNNMPISAYLTSYGTEWARLQSLSPTQHSYENRTLRSTWQMSLDQVRLRDPNAVEMLRLWGYVDNEDVWFDLVRGSGQDSGEGDEQPANTTVPEWFRSIARDELSFHSTMGILCNFCLAEPNTGARHDKLDGYSIHACMHAWVKDVLGGAMEDPVLMNLSLGLVSKSVPHENDAQWPVHARRLLHHAIAVASFPPFDSIARWRDLRTVARLFSRLLKLAEAQDLYERVLRIQEQSSQVSDISVFETANNLGNVYRLQNEVGKSEQLLQRALNGFTALLGNNAELSLDCSINLALVYRRQGRLEEAERMLNRAQQSCDSTTDRGFMATFNCIHNLGLVYSDGNRLEEAQQMLEWALDLGERRFGPSHLKTVSSAGALGLVCSKRGDTAKAQKMLRRAFDAHYEAYGRCDERTEEARKNLMSLHKMRKAENDFHMYINMGMGHQFSGSTFNFGKN